MEHIDCVSRGVAKQLRARRSFPAKVKVVRFPHPSAKRPERKGIELVEKLLEVLDDVFEDGGLRGQYGEKGAEVCVSLVGEPGIVGLRKLDHRGEEQIRVCPVDIFAGKGGGDPVASGEA